MSILRLVIVVLCHNIYMVIVFINTVSNDINLAYYGIQLNLTIDFVGEQRN